MARSRRNSKTLDAARQRAANIVSISPTLTLGNNISLEIYNEKISDTQVKLNSYTTLLAAIDAAANDLTEAEVDLADYSERMLTGVASIYGKNSNEYEMAGGVRKSERKRTVRKTSATSVTQAQ